MTKSDIYNMNSMDEVQWIAEKELMLEATTSGMTATRELETVRS